MRFLHLSDLHIGKTVNGFSMLEEQRNVFEQLIGYVKNEKPDAVLIAGDVYDRAVPSVEAVRLFDDFLTGLAAEEVVVMLISGNHDSPERLNYASRLLSDKKLHLFGVFDGMPRQVVLRDSFGEVSFWLLPFIKPAGIRGLFGEQEVDSYEEAVSHALAAADIDFSQRNVLLSHQYYTAAGVNAIRSESELSPVGGLDAIDAGVLARFDYVALGHLHGAQNVGESIRYAGSPLKYSFSECRQRKSAALIDLHQKGSGFDCTLLPLTPLKDMREIKGPLEQLLNDEVSSQGNREDYLRVTLTDEDEIIDPMGKLRSVYPNVMALAFDNTRTRAATALFSLDEGVAGDIGNAGRLEKIEALSPYELFSEFFLEVRGSVMSADQQRFVREFLEEEGGV